MAKGKPTGGSSKGKIGAKTEKKTPFVGPWAAGKGRSGKDTGVSNAGYIGAIAANNASAPKKPSAGAGAGVANNSRLGMGTHKRGRPPGVKNGQGRGKR